MIRAVFEGDIPSWSNPTVRTTRLAQWVAAGLNAVVLQVDIGFGATWPSTLMRQDPRIKGRTEPLRSCVDACHAAGLSVVLDFACASYNALAAIHPEYLLPNYFMPYYNYWDAGFQAWRSDTVAECAAYVDADGVALDYLRTGREAMGSEAPASEVLQTFIGLVRSKVGADYPLISVNHTNYIASHAEGVKVADWLTAGTVDKAVLFNYAVRFPSTVLASLDASKVWALAGNFDIVNGQVVKRAGREVAKDWRQIMRVAKPSAVAIYNANQMTDDQALHMNVTQLAMS